MKPRAIRAAVLAVILATPMLAHAADRDPSTEVYNCRDCLAGVPDRGQPVRDARGVSRRPAPYGKLSKTAGVVSLLIALEG